MEFGAVYVQPDVCNGCSYCVVACPFGVVQKNREDGRAFKCTFCSDRQRVGLEPACAKACPTQSIKFGEINDLRTQAQERLKELNTRGINDATVYDPVDTSVGGIHAFFLVRGDPRSYNLPPKPEVPTIYLKDGWRSAALAAGMLCLGGFFAFLSTPAQSRRVLKEPHDGRFSKT
jgi:formate dehydrogenase iron-sulfur subunit